jgi:hypothetical protein
MDAERGVATSVDSSIDTRSLWALAAALSRNESACRWVGEQG